MKKNSFLKMTQFAWVLVMALAIITTSCKKDDDDDTPGGGEIVLDGVYIKGAGTALADFDTKGKMVITRNEVLNDEYNKGEINEDHRPELVELYVAVKAGSDGFNIVTVAGSTKVTYGPGDDFAIVTEPHADEPKDGLWKGSVKETETPFTVETDGLYHVVFDTELKKIAIAKVNWGIIGGATPGGWGENTVFDAPEFNLETMTFTISSVTMFEDAWKFRYSNGWKIFLDEEFVTGVNDKIGLNVNTNFGGAINNLVPGGDNISNDKYYNYTYTFIYDLGSAFVATMEEESEPEPLPEFPEAMYLVGAGTAYGWDAPATHEDAIMHKCAGGGESEGLYWKILHLEAGQGFKVSAENWASPNLGFADVEEYDVNGVEVTDNGGNMDIAQSGMYMVLLDLRNDMTKLSVISPSVYGIGDVFGSWDEEVAENMFTIDNVNKTLVSPAFPNSGNVRMYVNHEWIPAWWNAEFNIFNGVIEYRNDGGDQEAVAVTAGQTATLHFDDNTGTIQ